MYQINIYRKQYSQPVDMAAIKTACAKWMTDDQGDPDRGGEFIYVQFGTVGVAVDAINALGYQTDEDVEDLDDREHMADELGL